MKKRSGNQGQPRLEHKRHVPLGLDLIPVKHLVFCEGTRLHVLDGKAGEPLLTFDCSDDAEEDSAPSIASAPVIADFDADGALDVFFVAGRGQYGQDGMLTKKNFGKGYAVRLGGSGKGWRTFRGNLHRTGRVVDLAK